MEKDSKKKNGIFGNLTTTILIIVLVLVAISGVTAAWLSISDNTRLNMMRLDVTTGSYIRFDLDSHDDFEDYITDLTYADISGRILQDYGVDVSAVPIQPVTTDNGTYFVFEDGSPASAGAGNYLEFTLHFISIYDMKVHLVSDDSRKGDDGTAIWSNNEPLVDDAMRMSITVDGQTFIYNPRTSNLEGLTNENTVFRLKANEEKVGTFRIWLEGTDPNCTNTLKYQDYNVRIRFEGSDENNNPIV